MKKIPQRVLAVVLVMTAAWGAYVCANYAIAKDPVVQSCQVFLIDDVQVPALETGQLVSVGVREGQLVAQNDLIGQIDDKQPQLLKASAEAERDAAQAKADDDIDVRFAQKSLELAETELNQDLAIKQNNNGAVTDSEIRRKQLVRTRELLGVDRSRLEQRIAKLTAQVKATQVQAAEDSIQRRKVIAPFAGQVVEVYRQSTEWVNAGEPVVRIIRIDQLYVDGFLHGDEVDATDVADRPVTIHVTLAAGRSETFTGRIVYVNPIVQAGNMHRIRAIVENRFERDQPLLRPGATATMTIHLEATNRTARPPAVRIGPSGTN